MKPDQDAPAIVSGEAFTLGAWPSHGRAEGKPEISLGLSLPEAGRRVALASRSCQDIYTVVTDGTVKNGTNGGHTIKATTHKTH